jgi:hypothetical protein
MLSINSVFLGQKGLSQSEANHTANVAKELATRINNDISSMSLFKERITINGETKDYNRVITIDYFEEKLIREGEIYALSAWLREGIKVKADLLIRIRKSSFADLDLAEPISYTSAPTLKTPTEQDIWEELGVSERAEYLTYESIAAHIGKKIHPGGLFAGITNSFKAFTSIDVKSTGTNVYIIERTPIHEKEYYDEVFFELQKRHREAEKMVNYWKATVQNRLNSKLQEIESENLKINRENLNKYEAYHSELRKIESEAAKIRLELTKKVSDLKIVVPNSLEDTLDWVQKYSKK